MKALVDKTSIEKSPYLQIMIKWVGFVVKIAEINEIRPFLDHIIDIFKIVKNIQNLYDFNCFFMIKKGDQ